MNVKSKKKLSVLVLVFCLPLSYFIWLSIRSVEVIAVHKDGNYASVLVKDFPVTDKGKIYWWLANRDKLQIRYGIPKPAAYGGFNITFWDFGNGYKKEGKYDRLCFDDMQTKISCIDKKPLFTVRRFNNERALFITYEGRYSLGNDGSIIQVDRD